MSEAEQAQETIRVARRPWVRLGIGALLSFLTTFLLLLTGALLYLFLTGPGLQFSLDLARGSLPQALSFERVEGRLAGPLTLHGFRYREADLDIRIESIHLKWAPPALFMGRFRVDLLEADGVEVISGAASDSGQPPQLSQINLPLELQLGQGRVRNIRVTNGESEPLVIDQITLAAGMKGSELALQQLAVQIPGASATIRGHARLNEDYPLQLSLDWDYRGLAGQPIRGDGVITGDLKHLQLQQHLSGALSAELAIELWEILAIPVIEGDLTLKALDPGQLDPEWPSLNLQGELSVVGTSEDLALDGRAAVLSQEYGEVQGEFTLSWDGAELKMPRLTARSDSGLTLDGVASWSAASGMLQADAAWSDLVWPLHGAPDLTAPRGSFQLQGTPDDYRLDLNGRFQARDAPPLDLNLTAKGDQRRLILEQLLLDLLGGEVSGEGQIGWAPAVEWQLKLQGKGLDPGIGWPEWSGELSGSLRTSGSLDNGRPDARLDIESISGRLRGYPLRLQGGVSLQGEDLIFRQLDLRSGDSRLQVDGSLAKEWDLGWSLRSEDLASLYPGAAGKLNASGSLAGARLQPRIATRLDARGVGFQQYRLERLKGELDLDLGQGDKFRLELRAGDLVLADSRWKSIELNGDGNRASHLLKLSARGGQVDIDTALKARLSGYDDWRGELTALEINAGEWGSWKLQSTGAFHLSPKASRLATSCLVDGKARLCAAANHQSAQGSRGELSLTALPLGRLAKQLPEGLILEGASDADLKFRLDAEGELAGSAQLTITQGVADFNLGEQPRRLDFSGSRMDLVVAHEGLTGSLDLPLKQGGAVVASLRMPGWSIKDPAGDQQLMDGNLKARLDQLDMLSGAVPDLAELKGRMEADLKIAGSLGNPAMKGYARLIDAGFELPGLGLRIEQIRLEVRNRGLDELIYQGDLLSGAGRLVIDGSTRLDAAQGWPTRLKLKGEGLTAADIPEAWLLVSPDLQITVEGHRIGLSGEVTVPRARIRPRALPETAVSSSPDLQFTQQSGGVGKAAATQIDAKVRLRLGDQVSFDGFGLRGLIRGDLLLSDEPGKPTLGNGQLGIHEGTYKAYGQDLEIRQGQVIFANSPVSNPGVAVTAVRNVREVEVGVNVSGTLTKPTLQVFSNPAMTQSEALAYLLFGGPLGRSSSASDKERMQSAATALAAGGGGWLAAEIGRQLGLDELSLQTGEESDLALHVGTYLSPRLYIQYITELASSSNQVKLRYDVTDRVQIQTETGTVHGADIFYTIEK